MNDHDTLSGHGPHCILTIVDVEEGPNHPARVRTFHDASRARFYAAEAAVSGNPVSINGHRFSIMEDA